MIIHKLKNYRHHISNFTRRIISFVVILAIGIILIIGHNQRTVAIPQLTPIQLTVDPPNTMIRPTYDSKGNPPTAPGLENES